MVESAMHVTSPTYVFHPDISPSTLFGKTTLFSIKYRAGVESLRQQNHRFPARIEYRKHLQQCRRK